MKYKEAQVHGEVDLRRHVERLVAHTRHRDKGEGDWIKARPTSWIAPRGDRFVTSGKWVNTHGERTRQSHGYKSPLSGLHSIRYMVVG